MSRKNAFLATLITGVVALKCMHMIYNVVTMSRVRRGKIQESANFSFDSLDFNQRQRISKSIWFKSFCSFLCAVTQSTAVALMSQGFTTDNLTYDAGYIAAFCAVAASAARTVFDWSARAQLKQLLSLTHSESMKGI